MLMDKRLANRIRLGLVLLWIVPTVLMFFGVSIAMLRDPDWPFGIGLIESKGIAGLWATIPMGLLGATALALLYFRRRTGAKLLIVYCLVWVVSLMGGVLKDWYQAGFQRPAGTSLSDWGAEILITGGLTLCFVLVTIWAWSQARRQSPSPETGLSS